jgi:hypothetical protein
MTDMFQHHWTTFWELIRTPFLHVDLVWGVVPLYFGWVCNELTSGKASFPTAVQTGFSFLWAGAHWMYQLSATNPHLHGKLDWNVLTAVNVIVTILVIFVGMMTLVSGLRRRYPKYCSFLGHTRFSNYFMITIFPIQSNYLNWSWNRLIAIALLAIPIWILIYILLLPLRDRKKR